MRPGAALPTTPQFLDYDSAYLLKNHFIRDESMLVENYTALFFPFDQPDMLFTESGVQWDISGDRDMMALAMTMTNKPMALNLCFQREYAERYDWLLTQFKDLAFTFMSSYLFYEDYDSLDDDTRNLYRQGMAVRAWLNVCPHAGRRLDWAPGQFLKSREGHLVCAAHGASFALSDGTCVAGPCRGDTLRAVAVQVRDGEVYLA